jgi:hypothetical protein
MLILTNPLSSTTRSSRKRSGDDGLHRLRSSERESNASFLTQRGKASRPLVGTRTASSSSRGIIPSSVPLDFIAGVRNSADPIRSHFQRRYRASGMSLFNPHVDEQELPRPLMMNSRPTKRPRTRLGSDRDEAGHEAQVEGVALSFPTTSTPAVTTPSPSRRRIIHMPTLPPARMDDFNNQLNPSTPTTLPVDNPEESEEAESQTDHAIHTPDEALVPLYSTTPRVVQRRKVKESPVSVAETGVSPIVSRLQLRESNPPDPARKKLFEDD